MNKDQLQLLLKSNFAVKKWHLERIAWLPPAFVQQTLVTPFFQPRVLRKSAANYLIDGYLGVLHRDFEKHWIESDSVESESNFHCLALNIANVDSLRASQHIGVREAEGAISRFCSAVLEKLEALPHNEATLRLAFEINILMNAPLEKFVIHARTKKLSRLRAFVLDRVSHLN